MNEHLNGWRLHQQNLALSNAVEDAKYFARRDALAKLIKLLREHGLSLEPGKP